jgi:methanogenic corrinoid protein MtbC1
VLASRASFEEPATGGQPAVALDAERTRAELARAVEAFDEPAVQATIDELLSAGTIDAVLSSVVVPFLRDIGDRWQRGELSVAHEHFASNVLRGRLLGLARGWGAGSGRRAVLACPPGERHDLGLIVFGLALRARGWRIDFLGSDTPPDSIATATNALTPALLVVSATTPDLLLPILDELAELAGHCAVAIAGAGARDVPAPGGVLTLAGEPVEEAARVSELVDQRTRAR